jgi:hypothetical protein
VLAQKYREQFYHCRKREYECSRDKYDSRVSIFTRDAGILGSSGKGFALREPAKRLTAMAIIIATSKISGMTSLGVRSQRMIATKAAYTKRPTKLLIQIIYAPSA